ncbi:hypothetical protein Emag_005419 [Eimeria magna]
MNISGWPVCISVYRTGSDSPTSTREFNFDEAQDDSHVTARSILTRLEEMDASWTDTATPLTFSASLSAENSPQSSTVEQGDVDEPEFLQALAPRPRPSSRPVGRGVVCLSVALLVWLGLLGYRAHRRGLSNSAYLPGLLEGKHAEPLGGGAKDLVVKTARERVAWLRQLMPPAEKLAKAIATDEAERLLTAARNRLWEGEKAAAGDLIGLEGSVESAVSALNKLHHLARKTAATWAEESSDSIKKTSDFLNTWGEHELSFNEEERMGLNPFITTLTASKEHHDRVHKQILQMNENIQSQKPLELWLDKTAFLSTANDLEALRSATSEKKYAALITERLRLTALEAVKGVLNVQREQLARWFQQELEMLNAYALSQLSSAPEASAASEEQIEGPKMDVKEMFHEAKSLVTAHRRAAMDAQGMQTLENLIEANKATVDAERRAQAYFARTWIDIEDAGITLGQLGEYNPYKSVLQKASIRILQDNRMIEALHSRFRSSCSHLFPELNSPEGKEKQYVNRSIIKDLLQKIDDDLNLSRSLVEDLNRQEERIAGGHDVAEASGRATTVAVAMALVRQQVTAKLLRLQLLGFVEEDVRSSQALVVSTASQTSPCSRSSAAIIQQLTEKFKVQMKTFKEAEELKSATKLARDVRTRADELSIFSYVNTKHKADTA